MTDWELVKRPKLENGSNASTYFQQLPFSQYLTNAIHNQKHPILSDKKLIVYDLKIDKPELDEAYKHASWLRLERAIHAIQHNQPCAESLEVLYQLCEDLCQYDFARDLYQHVHDACSQHIDLQFQTLANHSTEGLDYLRVVHSTWRDYGHQMSQIRCLFLYLDRTYMSTTKTGSLWNMAMDLFRTRFSLYDIVWQKTLSSILDLIRQERSCQSIDESFLQSNIRMLMDLDLYHASFEQHLLIQTKAFYSEEGDQLLTTLDVFDYLQHASMRVHQESILRVKNYFDKSLKLSLQSIVEQELLTKRVQVILEKCFDYFERLDLFQDTDYDKFSLLYRLLQKIDHLEICAKYFTAYVKKKGSSIMNAKTSVKERIMMLSAFETQTDEMVDHSFEGDDQFADGLKDGIEYFVNLRENNAIKLLAKYTDSVFKSAVYEEGLLEKAMFLFRYLQAKDTFEMVYKRDLAKRLLLNTTHKQGEKAMLAKMKKICGAGYTGKMEGMVKDIEKSAELMHEFNTAYSPRLNMHVNLLTYGFWPSYVSIEVHLPPLFKQAQTMYSHFYSTKFQKRVLTWHHSLGVCDIKACYPKGEKTITVTLVQAVVLLLFNQATTFTFKEILVSTQLDELELRRVLVSLACREHKLLIKYPEGQEIEPTDTFVWHDGFQTDKSTFSMIAATLSEVIEKDAHLDTPVLFAREQQMDAVIVRIMKSKGTLSHGQLLNEVTCLVSFPVTAQEIKKRIEVLIDKEYLERSLHDSYRYLA
ncbi:Cullin family-domain-containing protein [Gilbertella persicaria]|uniref:Cullin family-domain-containing protein n=1 Tax=Gilbertella persicaria TaxID=101096 RepID=UPI0022208850|nr:Cullin family-domain-containing protein [Gilbertella persicaria]KAI8066197.1 Cullin family-domain-containing protein [Gilbertella persicaria]